MQAAEKKDHQNDVSDLHHVEQPLVGGPHRHERAHVVTDMAVLRLKNASEDSDHRVRDWTKHTPDGE